MRTINKKKTLLTYHGMQRYKKRVSKIDDISKAFSRAKKEGKGAACFTGDMGSYLRERIRKDSYPIVYEGYIYIVGIKEKDGIKKRKLLTVYKIPNKFLPVEKFMLLDTQVDLFTKKEDMLNKLLDIEMLDGTRIRGYARDCISGKNSCIYKIEKLDGTFINITNTSVNRIKNLSLKEGSILVEKNDIEKILGRNVKIYTKNWQMIIGKIIDYEIEDNKIKYYFYCDIIGVICLTEEDIDLIYVLEDSFRFIKIDKNNILNYIGFGLKKSVKFRSNGIYKVGNLLEYNYITKSFLFKNLDETLENISVNTIKKFEIMIKDYFKENEDFKIKLNDYLLLKDGQIGKVIEVDEIIKIRKIDEENIKEFKVSIENIESCYKVSNV